MSMEPLLNSLEILTIGKGLEELEVEDDGMKWSFRP
jgi:hypothetical protein